MEKENGTPLVRLFNLDPPLGSLLLCGLQFEYTSKTIADLTDDRTEVHQT